MLPFDPMVDIHCHLVPGIDDGAASWDQTLTMARMAADDGIGTVIVTPHQLGSFAHNDGDVIRTRTAEVQQELDRHRIYLEVLPGADVRIEADLAAQLQSGRVLTLADRGRHVLLELPHELYFPLEEVLESLRGLRMVGILSHPERNQGLLKQPQLIPPLIARGCLMQVTCGSLMGAFGAGPRQMAEWMLEEGLVHFLATDAHSPTARRPLMARAYQRAVEIAGKDAAIDWVCRNPTAVAEGREVPAAVKRRKRGGLFAGFFKRRRAA